MTEHDAAINDSEVSDGEIADPLALPDYAETVLDVVDAIPAGQVMTYGDIAEWLGTGGPRQVGSVMSHYGSATNWWRVIRADGRPPACHEGEAHEHYAEEGTPLTGKRGSRVDLRRARWEGPPPEAGAEADREARSTVGDS